MGINMTTTKKVSFLLFCDHPYGRPLSAVSLARPAGRHDTVPPWAQPSKNVFHDSFPNRLEIWPDSWTVATLAALDTRQNYLQAGITFLSAENHRFLRRSPLMFGGEGEVAELVWGTAPPPGDSLR